MPSNIWKQTLNDKNPASTRVVVTGVAWSLPLVTTLTHLPTTYYQAFRGAAPITLFDAEKFPTDLPVKSKISILQILLTQSCPSEWIVLRI